MDTRTPPQPPLGESTQSAAGYALSASHSATLTLPGSTYTVRYNAQDASGNLSQTHEVTVTIDRTAPMLQAIPGNRFTTGGPDVYGKISVRLTDASGLDRYVINGVEHDLAGRENADVAGRNAATLTFTLRAIRRRQGGQETSLRTELSTSPSQQVDVDDAGAAKSFWSDGVGRTSRCRRS